MRSPAALSELTAPVQFLPGCGPARGALLARLGVLTVRDLLFFFPRDYQDLTDLRPLDQFEDGAVLSLVGTVAEVDVQTTAAGRSLLGVLVRQGNEHLRALWFNQAYLQERFRVGQTLMLSGKARRRLRTWEMVHPVVRWLDAEPAETAGQILPVYPLTEGLEQRHLRRLTRTALDRHALQLEEVFPASYLSEHNLAPLAEALPAIHFPPCQAALERARRRLVYQELLILQLALALRKQQTRAGGRALPLPASAKIDARIRRLFPFELTAAQHQAIQELTADLHRDWPMNRLLQGDVGSGKTVVAVYALLLAVAHGAQAALLAPTEVLARQHYETLFRSLAASHVRLGLLAGSQPARQRDEVLEGLRQGQVQIAVGTQALLEPNVEFQRLALVVIDEQHKFGVRQRARFRGAQIEPHYLVMTATPIPRTVGMTLYGDLDVSTLREGPPGRPAIHTYLPAAAELPKWWEFVRRKLREGRQAYVVAPLVEGTDEADSASAEALFESLANGELEAFRLGLVHGRLSGEAKEDVMHRFRQGQVQALVATAVVEVGVDVPNATLMTVFAAERFGLAQLHQLRGRVGRGTFPGYCCLLADQPTPDAQARLQAILDSNDGFELAERDFALRGPGDLLGTQQHGLPPLRLADLRRDAQLLAEARRDAQALVAAQPGLAGTELAALRRMVLARYGAWLELADVG